MTEKRGATAAQASLVVISVLTLGFAVCLAQETQEKPKTPVIDKRERNQKARIKEGVKSGELTKRETALLAAEQRKIKKDEAKAKADGTVTPEERQKLRREEKRASKDIYKQKHNKEKRDN